MLHAKSIAIPGDAFLYEFMTNAQQDFLAAKTYAVAGASSDRRKYGNLVFRALIDHTDSDSGRKVYALNPNAEQIEGHAAFADIVERRFEKKCPHAEPTRAPGADVVFEDRLGLSSALAAQLGERGDLGIGVERRQRIDIRAQIRAHRQPSGFDLVPAGRFRRCVL